MPAAELPAPGTSAGGGLPGATGASLASDALGSLVAWLARVPELRHTHLVCPGGPAEVPGDRDGVAVVLPTCAADIPLSAYLELALAGALSLTVHPADGCHGDLPALADARALLGRAGREVGTDTGERRHRWSRVRTVRAVPVRSLALPRRAVIAPVIGVRRPGGRGRAATERGRLMEALTTLRLSVTDVGEVQRARVPVGDAGCGAASAGDRGSGAAAAVRDGDGVPPTASASVAVPAPTLDAVPQPAPTPAPAASAVLAAAGCTACGVCVRTCPEGALALGPLGAVEDGAESRTLLLSQAVASCSDCGACTAICPAGALTRTGSRGWDELPADAGWTELARLTTAHCRRCRAEYAPAEDDAAPGRAAGLCPVCADRRRSPFGSSLPPAAAALLAR